MNTNMLTFAKNATPQKKNSKTVIFFREHERLHMKVQKNLRDTVVATGQKKISM